MDDYTRYNGRRKPELIDPGTFSLTNYGEADRVEGEWRSLSARVDKLAAQLPEDERASFFELVQYPVDASATVTEMYIAAGRNALDARLGHAQANDDAAETRRLFARDAELSDEYNHKLLDGRWDHMMDQTHIGYTMWQEPPLNAMPAVTEVQIPKEGSLSLTAEGGAGFRPSLGTLDSVAQQTRAIRLFNRGATPVGYQVTTSAPWIVVDHSAGTVARTETLDVHIDWNQAPAGAVQGSVTITPQGAAPMVVGLSALHISRVNRENAEGFVESDGYVAIEAADTTGRGRDGAEHWEELPGFGETHSAMTIFPVTTESKPKSAADLEYRMYLYDEGNFTLLAMLAPTLNFVPGRGLRFAVSVDDGPRTLVDALQNNTQKDWETAVSDGVKKVTLPISISKAGYHTLKIWAVDPGVVVERFIVSHGPLRPSYLGPPESFHAHTDPHQSTTAVSAVFERKEP